MSGMQIALLIAGGAVFIISFFISDRKGRKEALTDAAGIAEDQVKYLVEKEIDEARLHIQEVVDETAAYAMEKTERAMDRLTNEKMLAINEYSDTVLGEINRNQQEVVFLYDMMNDKHEVLKKIVSQAAVTASDLQKTVQEAGTVVPEAGVPAVFQPLPTTQFEIIAPPRHAGEPAPYAGQTAASLRSASADNQPKSKSTNNLLLSEASDSGAAAQKIIDQAGRSVDNTRISNMNNDNAGNYNTNINSMSMNSANMNGTNINSANMNGTNMNGANINSANMNDTNMSGTNMNGTNINNVDMRIRNNNERILGLHKAGNSNITIARDLGLGVGEVKLVIDLFEGTNQIW